MLITWLVAVLDVPASQIEADVKFWQGVTAARATVGDDGQGRRTTLVPGDGDSFLRLCQSTAGVGCQLEIHSDDANALVEVAVGLGARLEEADAPRLELLSPAGLRFCSVAWAGQRRRPAPVSWPGGHRSLVDQLCIDISPTDFDDECDFWARLTASEHLPGGAGFRYLPRPEGIPLRLLLQRLESTGSPRANSHLDLACSDVETECHRHEALGASVIYHGAAWTTLRDPAGIAYCITQRDPDTGRL